MRACLAVMSIAAGLGTSMTASTADLDCTAFLTGTWVGEGKVDMFGTSREVDNTYVFNSDGSFRTINRYRSDGDGWNEQDVSGTWSATEGAVAGTCDVRMETTGTGMAASVTSTYSRIDNDTVSTIGFEMQRARPNGDGG